MKKIILNIKDKSKFETKLDDITTLRLDYIQCVKNLKIVVDNEDLYDLDMVLGLQGEDLFKRFIMKDPIFVLKISNALDVAEIKTRTIIEKGFLKNEKLEKLYNDFKLACDQIGVEPSETDIEVEYETYDNTEFTQFIDDLPEILKRFKQFVSIYPPFTQIDEWVKSLVCSNHLFTFNTDKNKFENCEGGDPLYIFDTNIKFYKSPTTHKIVEAKKYIF